MKVQIKNLMKHRIFNVGLVIAPKEKFVSLGLGIVSIFIFIPEEENNDDKQ